MKGFLKDTALIVIGSILAWAAFSLFMATVFRDVRTGPMWDYLTGYFFHRFLDFFLIYFPWGVVCALLVLPALHLCWAVMDLLKET